jgi:exopolysaccharide biosynthesis protein
MMVIFFVICILLVVFDDNVGRKICTIILTLIIFSMFLFDLLYLQTFTFYDEGFKTNYLINTDVEQYKNKLLKKVVVNYKYIKKIEERTYGKHKKIYLYTHNDELVSIDVEYHFEEIFTQLKNSIN